MTESRTPARRRYLGAGVAVVAVAVIGIVLISVAVTGSRTTPPAAPGFEVSTGGNPSPSTTPTPASSSSSSSSSSPTASAPGPSAGPSTRKPDREDAKPAELKRSVPRTIRIPSIGVDSSFVGLGLDENRELEAPEDAAQVGWFTDASTPGSRGVAVVAGHVTWNREPTVFFRLGELREGDRIEIGRADGSVAIFAATRRATFPKDEFPTAEVYRRAARPELVLVTCGGAYDQEDHSYDSNVIVWADLVGSRRGPS